MKVKSIKKVHFSAMLDDIPSQFPSVFPGQETSPEKYTIVYFMTAYSALRPSCFSFLTNGKIEAEICTSDKNVLLSSFPGQAVMHHD